MLMAGEFLNQEEIAALLSQEQAELLIKANQRSNEVKGDKENWDGEPGTEEENKELSEQEGKLELILDIPLTISVILGKTKKPIQEILCFQSGSIIELNSLVDEDVDILVNNVLVAKGEVVVINDDFGVRITNILNTTERMLQLKRGVI
ncbi:MAG: flagellar motor switch protein FliN [Desulfitobacteriaceae bacterium]|nr:flagellar motor switch protein FliN [Desulfitobacteriaceae bacterium]